MLCRMHEPMTTFGAESCVEARGLQGWGQDHPTGKGDLGVCPAHWKALRLWCGVCSKKESVLNNMTARLRPPTAVLLTAYWCHFTFSPVKKIRPLRCGLSSKFFSHWLALHTVITKQQAYRSSQSLWKRVEAASQATPSIPATSSTWLLWRCLRGRCGCGPTDLSCYTD